MWAYILRRLLYTPLIVFGVLLVTFVLFKLVPGNPARIIAGPGASESTIKEIEAQIGLDKPRWINVDGAREQGFGALFDSQFFRHMWDTPRFEFGDSVYKKKAVSEILYKGAGPSLKLTVPMFIALLATSISISLGITMLRGTVWDLLIVIACVIGMSIPFLAVILFGQDWFAGKLDWFPIRGYDTGFAGVRYYVLPVILGVFAGLGSDVRFYRTVMLDEAKADYIRTAYAKGVGTGRVLFRHLLKNAMIAVITRVVLAIPFLFLGSLLLERFFSIPGLGFLMVESISSRDYNVIAALTYIVALLFIFGQLMTDICYALVDPRISLK